MNTKVNKIDQAAVIYSKVVPIVRDLHSDYGFSGLSNAALFGKMHAIPLAVDEFGVAHRDYPIVFGLGEGAAPLALVSLREGHNVFVDAAGQWEVGRYVPAWVRRYPFLLAKVSAEAAELTLCFDESAGLVTPEAGEKLFVGEDPSETTKRILAFCEQFERAAQHTRSVVTELERLELLIDGEAAIRRTDLAQPAVFRGFRMVDEKKLQALKPAQAHKLVESGLLGLVYAHLLSLGLLPQLFERQFGAELTRAT